MPAYARLATDQDRLTAAVLNNLRLLLMVTLPACTALGLLAVPLIDVLYGSKWAAAATVLAPLAVLAAVRIVTELMYDLHVAMAWTARIFKVQLVWLAALVPALVLGATRNGIQGVAIGQALVGSLVGLPLYMFALRRIGIRLLEVLKVALPAVASCGLMAMIILVLRRADPPSAVLLSIAIPACCAAAVLPHRRVIWPFLAAYKRGATT
jgi:PST family polysaccharide transporter